MNVRRWGAAGAALVLAFSLFTSAQPAVADDKVYIGGQYATPWEASMVDLTEKVYVDGVDVTAEVGPLVEMNGKTLVWGTGLIGKLGGKRTWHGENSRIGRPGTILFSIKDRYANTNLPIGVLFDPGLYRGCGSNQVLTTWNSSIVKNAPLHFLNLPDIARHEFKAPVPACNFFDSEMTYVEMRHLVGSLKMNATYNATENAWYINTDELPSPKWDLVAKVPIVYKGSNCWTSWECGFALQQPRGGFTQNPAEVLYAWVTTKQNFAITRTLHEQDFNVTDGGDYAVVTGKNGTLYAHVYPTHVVVYMNAIDAKTFLVDAEAELGWQAGWLGSVATLVSGVLDKETGGVASILRAITVGSTMGGLYYLGEGKSLKHLSACYDNMGNWEDLRENDETLPASTFGMIIANDRVTGCTYYPRYVGPSEALGGQW